jgi:hypothetical protein
VRRIYHNAQGVVEDWLRKIKIYKIEKLDNVFLIDEGLIGKENLI